MIIYTHQYLILEQEHYLKGTTLRGKVLEEYFFKKQEDLFDFIIEHKITVAL